MKYFSRIIQSSHWLVCYFGLNNTLVNFLLYFRFSEFVYEIVVDKKFVPNHILDVLKQKPIVLPPWDPMGALASRDCGEI